MPPPFLTSKEPSCAYADREAFLGLRIGHLISLLQQSSASATCFVLGVSGWEQSFNSTPLDKHQLSSPGTHLSPTSDAVAKCHFGLCSIGEQVSVLVRMLVSGLLVRQRSVWKDGSICVLARQGISHFSPHSRWFLVCNLWDFVPLTTRRAGNTY